MRRRTPRQETNHALLGLVAFVTGGMVGINRGLAQVGLPMVARAPSCDGTAQRRAGRPSAGPQQMT
jgi:hypothetical protein